MKKKRRRKMPACQECGMLTRHPYCPICRKKCHWIGFVEDTGGAQEEIQKGAPARKIDHPASIAYLLPFMAKAGQLPEEEVGRVTEQVLAKCPHTIIDTAVWSFTFTKHPYRFKVVEANLTGAEHPYVKIRYAGWSCRDHKGATPADVPGLALERDGYSCVVCGSQENVLVSYLVRPEHKGETMLGNCATFCVRCRDERGDRDYWTFLRSKDITIREIIVDFKSGYVRSIARTNRIIV